MAEVPSFVIASALFIPSQGSTGGETFATTKDSTTGHHSVHTKAEITNTDPIPTVTTISNTTPIPVSLSDQAAGTTVRLSSDPAMVTDGTVQILIDEIVPPGEEWSLRTCKVVCGIQGNYEVTIDGERKDFGTTGPGEVNLITPYLPGDIAASGQNVVLTYQQTHGPTGCDVWASLLITQAP